jgi:hypothetical protein
LYRVIRPYIKSSAYNSNNPLPPAPNVCVPEVFNYTDFTKVAILSSDTEKLGERLKQNWKPRRDFVRKCIYNVVCLFDRNQNLLLCTPLVYMHLHGPYHRRSWHGPPPFFQKQVFLYQVQSRNWTNLDLDGKTIEG